MIDQKEYIEGVVIHEGVECLYATQAALFLSRQFGREVKSGWLSNPVKRGELHPFMINGRNLYPIHELRQLKMADKPGRRPGVGLTPAAKKAISEGQAASWHSGARAPRKDRRAPGSGSSEE